MTAIAWNVLLSRVSGYAFAETARMSMLSLRTMLEVRGANTDGVSTFSAQARHAAPITHEIWNPQPASLPWLLLADEIFFGTTPDQIVDAARELIVQATSRGHLAVITSQIPELQAEALPGIQMVHNGPDFRILPGPATDRDRNAPAIMEVEGNHPAYVDGVRRRQEERLRR